MDAQALRQRIIEEGIRQQWMDMSHSRDLRVVMNEAREVLDSDMARRVGDPAQGSKHAIENEIEGFMAGNVKSALSRPVISQVIGRSLAGAKVDFLNLSRDHLMLLKAIWKESRMPHPSI